MKMRYLFGMVYVMGLMLSGADEIVIGSAQSRRHEARTGYARGAITFDWQVMEAKDEKSWHRIVSCRDADSILMIYRTPDSQLAFMIRDLKNARMSICTLPLAADAADRIWRVAAAWDEKQLRLCIDGRQYAEKPRQDQLNAALEYVTLGGPFGAAPDSMVSRVGNLKILPEPLSKEDMKKLHSPDSAQKSFFESAGFREEDNLIQEASLAAVIASSTAAPGKHDVDVLQDGDPDTYFQAGKPDDEPFIEIRHRFPVNVKTIAMQLHSSAPAGKLTLRRFIDGRWQDAPHTIKEFGGGIAISCPDMPPLARYRIGFGNELKIAELMVFGGRVPILRASKTDAVPELNVASIRISGDRLTKGDSFEAAAVFRPWTGGKQEITLVARLGMEELEPQFTDLSISRDCLVVTAEEMNGPAVFRLSIPDYAPGGEYVLKLSAFSRNGQIPVEGGSVRLKIDGGELKYSENDFPRTEIVGNQIAVNGKTVSPLMLTFGSFSLERLQAYKHTGIKILQIQNLSAPLLYGVKPAEEDFAFSCAVIDQDIRAALSMVPDAYIFVLPCTRPRGSWNEKNPDEMVITAAGKKDYHSFSSARWLETEKQGMRYLVNYLRRQPYASRIIGISPYFGRGGDGWAFGIEANLYKKRAEAQVGDYSRNEINNFRDFLRKKYGNDPAKLRSAYRQDEIDFDTVMYSSPLLAGTENFTFRDVRVPGVRLAADYWEFHSATVADAILACAAEVKAASDRRLLYSVHYSYTGQVLVNWTPGFGQVSGALALRRILESPDVDLLCSGISGNLKVQGKMVDYPHPLGSLALHNKKNILETDLRTYLIRTSGNYAYYQHYSLAETLTVLKRDFAVALIHNSGSRYYDMQSFAMPALGKVPWLMDEQIISTIAASEEIYRAELADPAHSAAEIAVIIDSEVGYYQDIYAATLYRNLFVFLREELARLGAPADFFFAPDLESVLKSGKYKLIIGMNCFRMTSAQRRLLSQARKQDKCGFLWFFAPGYLDEEGFHDAAYIGEATGFDVGVHNREEELTMTAGRGFAGIFGETHKEIAIRPWDGGQLAIFGRAIGPVFHVRNPDVVLAHHKSDRSTAFAMNRRNGRADFYSAVPFLPADVLREIARLNGVHIYCADGVLFDANSRYFTVHNGGESKTATITLPGKPSKVVEVFSAGTISENGNEITLALKPYETILGKIE